jgi:hypothetical protein
MRAVAARATQLHRGTTEVEAVRQGFALVSREAPEQRGRRRDEELVEQSCGYELRK